jgi:hypothetical protein
MIEGHASRVSIYVHDGGVERRGRNVRVATVKTGPIGEHDAGQFSEAWATVQKFSLAHHHEEQGSGERQGARHTRHDRPPVVDQVRPSKVEKTGSQ